MNRLVEHTSRVTDSMTYDVVTNAAMSPSTVYQTSGDTYKLKTLATCHRNAGI